MSQIDSTVQNALSFLNNEYVNVGVCSTLVLYTAFLAPKLGSGTVANLLNNEWVALVLFLAIALVSRQDFTVALLMAVAVFATLVAMNRNYATTVASASACNCNNSGTAVSLADTSGLVDQPAAVAASKVAVDGSNGEDYEQVGPVEQSQGLDGYSEGTSYASA